MDEVITPTTILPEYCHRYGWLADPFGVNNDKAPFYVPSYWDHYLDLIQYIQQHDNALITITGPGGSGKSTFLKQLLLQIDSNILTCVIDAKMPLTSQSLIENMSTAFLSQAPAGDTIEEQFDYLLNAIQFKSQHFLLLIDNAQLLTNDVVQNILYCIEQQTDYQMRLHIILAGDSSLKQLLDTISFSRTKQIVVRTLTLQQLKQQEIHHYLQHRINNIGDQNQNPFNSDIIKTIHSESKNYPHEINLKAKHVLLHGFNSPSENNNQTNRSTSAPYKNGLITLCLIIAIIIVATFHLPAKKNNVIQGTLYKESTLSPPKNDVHFIAQKTLPNALYPNNNVNTEHGVQLNQSQLNSINNLNLLTNPVTTNQTKTLPKKSAKINNKKKKENKIQIINANLS